MTSSEAAILILAPHADDETYGCAGTIAKAKALGAEVYVVVVTVGDLDHYDGHGGSPPERRAPTSSTR